MRSGVTSPLYKVRKALEESVDRWVPALGFATQYSRVSFANERYSEVERAVRRQGRVLMGVLGGALGVGIAGVVIGIVWMGRGWGFGRGSGRGGVFGELFGRRGVLKGWMEWVARMIGL